MKGWQIEAVQTLSPLLAELKQLVSEFERRRDSGDMKGARELLAKLEPLAARIVEIERGYGIQGQD